MSGSEQKTWVRENKTKDWVRGGGGGLTKEESMTDKRKEISLLLTSTIIYTNHESDRKTMCIDELFICVNLTAKGILLESPVSFLYLKTKSPQRNINRQCRAENTRHIKTLQQGNNEACVYTPTLQISSRRALLSV